MSRSSCNSLLQGSYGRPDSITSLSDMPNGRDWSQVVTSSQSRGSLCSLCKAKLTYGSCTPCAIFARETCGESASCTLPCQSTGRNNDRQLRYELLLALAVLAYERCVDQHFDLTSFCSANFAHVTTHACSYECCNIGNKSTGISSATAVPQAPHNKTISKNTHKINTSDVCRFLSSLQCVPDDI